MAKTNETASTTTHEDNDNTNGRRSVSNLRRRSLLEKQQEQKRRDEELEREEQARRSLRRRRRQRDSSDNEMDLTDEGAAPSSQAAKRPCRRRPSSRAFPLQVTANLEKAFQVNSYPGEAEIDTICDSTGLTDKQVRAKSLN